MKFHKIYTKMVLQAIKKLIFNKNKMSFPKKNIK